MDTTPDPIVNVGPVRHWLGLGMIPPEGLHGDKRKRLVGRYTRETPGEDAVFFAKALARAYSRDRERRLLHLLRYHALDDDFWRMIYAVMVRGGPIVLGSLIRTLARLSSPDRAISDREAIRLWQAWDSHHRRSPQDVTHD